MTFAILKVILRKGQFPLPKIYIFLYLKKLDTQLWFMALRVIKLTRTSVGNGNYRLRGHEGT